MKRVILIGLLLILTAAKVQADSSDTQQLVIPVRIEGPGTDIVLADPEGNALDRIHVAENGEGDVKTVLDRLDNYTFFIYQDPQEQMEDGAYDRTRWTVEVMTFRDEKDHLSCSCIIKNEGEKKEQILFQNQTEDRTVPKTGDTTAVAGPCAAAGGSLAAIIMLGLWKRKEAGR